MGRAAMLRAAVATLVVGALLGYVATTFVVPLVQDSGVLGGSREPPAARAYMVGLLRNDPETLSSLRPTRDIVSRALELQGSDHARGQFTPISMTYLGGGSEGKVSFHLYAVEVRASAGDQFFPLALTVVNGKVYAAK